MPEARRIILITLNLVSVGIALLVFIVLSMRRLPSSEGSTDQLQQKLSSISEPSRLRRVITHDDEYIRSLEHVIATSIPAARGILVLFSTLAGLNLVLLFLPQPKTRQLPEGATLYT